MLRDLLFNFFHCATPGCVVWNIVYLFGVYLLGLWMAHQIWVRPWRRHWTDGREGAYQRVATAGAVQEAPATFSDEKHEEATREEEAVLESEETENEAEDSDKGEDVDSTFRNAALGAAGIAGAGAILGLAGDKEDEEEKKEDPVSDAEEAEMAQCQIDQFERKYGDEDLRIDPLLGVVYDDPPVTSDDLTRIDGIDMDLEGYLNDLGVHRLEQIANWSPKNVDEFSNRLHLGEQIENDDWVSQARHLVGLNGSTAEVEMEDDDAAEDLVDSNVEENASESADVNVSGEEARLAKVVASDFANEHVEVDSEMGILYLTTPEVDDDLTEINSITGDLERALNRLGVHRFAQIAHWSERHEKGVAEQLGISVEIIEDEDWAAQADRLYRETYRASQVWSDANPSLEEYETRIDEDYQGEDVRADGSLGILYSSAPDDADELTEVEGISDLMSQWLQDSGVYRFRQIADWSEMNVANFADRLDLPKDRIYSERWIPQAQELAAKAQFSELA